MWLVKNTNHGINAFRIIRDFTKYTPIHHSPLTIHHEPTYKFLVLSNYILIHHDNFTCYHCS